MKTDDRMAEKILHLENDIKVLKNEVQAVLVDLKDKYMEAGNPFTALPAIPAPAPQKPVVVLQAPAASKAISDAPATPQQMPVEQKPVANEAKSDTKLNSSSVEKEGRDKIEKTAGVSGAERETHPEPARGKVIEAQVPEEVPVARQGRDPIPGRDITLISIAALVNWAEESVKKLGHQKTEAILDVAEMMGLLSPQLKQIMTKLINIDSDGKAQSVSARVLLNSLVKITTLLGKDNQTEAALLSILSAEEDRGENHHTPW